MFTKDLVYLWLLLHQSASFFTMNFLLKIFRVVKSHDTTISNADLYLSYFYLSYIFPGRNDSVVWGLYCMYWKYNFGHVPNWKPVLIFGPIQGQGRSRMKMTYWQCLLIFFLSVIIRSHTLFSIILNNNLGSNFCCVFKRGVQN